MFLGSSVFLGLKGQCPTVYGRISRAVTSDYEGDQKPALLNAQALVKEKAEEELGYSVTTVKALPESGSRNYLDTRERSEVWK